MKLNRGSGSEQGQTGAPVCSDKPLKDDIPTGDGGKANQQGQHQRGESDGSGMHHDSDSLGRRYNRPQPSGGLGL
jgi:hypothetical protein